MEGDAKQIQSQAGNAASPPRFQTRRVLTVSFAHMMHDIYSSFLAPLLPLLIEKLALSYTLAGSLSLFQRLPSVVNPFIGIIADRFHARHLLIWAPAVTAVAMSLLGIMANIYGVIVCLLISGISSTLFHVPGPVVINRVAGARTGRGMSFYMLGGELARTLGPLFVLAAVSWWGLEGTVRLIPLGVAASLLLWTQIPVSQESLPTAGRMGRDIWKATWRLRRFFLLLFGVVWFRSLPKTAMTIFLPTFMTEQGSGLVMAGSSLAILQFAGAAGTLLAGSLSDTLGRRWVLMLAALVSPVLVWLFLITSGGVALVCLVASGFTLFASGPVLLALVQDHGAQSPATVNGVYMTLNFLIQSATAFLIGVMGDHFGLMLTFKLSAVISVAAFPFIWALSDRTHRS